MAAFIDAEHALDVGYARKLGVNVGELLVSQPDTGEQALEIAEQLVRSGACDILVVDSVAALVPKAEIEGEMGDPHMGLQARLMSQAMRKLTSVVSRNLSTVVFINQIRMKIGVVFGNPETTTGGQALKFYASVRLDIRRIGQLKEGEQVVGSRTRVKVVKNKVAPPFREAEFDVRYGVGVDRLAEALDLGVERGIVEKSGAYFSLDGERIGQGRERASEWLREHPAALESLVARIAGRPARAARRGRGVVAGPRRGSLRAERPVLPAEREAEAARRGRVLDEAHPERDLRRAGEAGVVSGRQRGAEPPVPSHPQRLRERAVPGRRRPAPAWPRRRPPAIADDHEGRPVHRHRGALPSDPDEPAAVRSGCEAAPEHLQRPLVGDRLPVHQEAALVVDGEAWDHAGQHSAGGRHCRAARGGIGGTAWRPPSPSFASAARAPRTRRVAGRSS